MKHPPATCPRCSAATVNVTFRGAPIYECGSTPHDLICDPDRIAYSSNTPNLETPASGELADLWRMGLLAPRYVVPIIGICNSETCERTAIDGWCNEHEAQIARAVARGLDDPHMAHPRPTVVPHG